MCETWSLGLPIAINPLSTSMGTEQRGMIESMHLSTIKLIIERRPARKWKGTEIHTSDDWQHSETDFWCS